MKSLNYLQFTKDRFKTKHWNKISNYYTKSYQYSPRITFRRSKENNNYLQDWQKRAGGLYVVYDQPINRRKSNYISSFNYFSNIDQFIVQLIIQSVGYIEKNKSPEYIVVEQDLNRIKFKEPQRKRMSKGRLKKIRNMNK